MKKADLIAIVAGILTAGNNEAARIDAVKRAGKLVAESDMLHQQMKMAGAQLAWDHLVPRGERQAAAVQQASENAADVCVAEASKAPPLEVRKRAGGSTLFTAHPSTGLTHVSVEVLPAAKTIPENTVTTSPASGVSSAVQPTESVSTDAPAAPVSVCGPVQPIKKTRKPRTATSPVPEGSSTVPDAPPANAVNLSVEKSAIITGLVADVLSEIKPPVVDDVLRTECAGMVNAWPEAHVVKHWEKIKATVWKDQPMDQLRADIVNAMVNNLS